MPILRFKNKLNNLMENVIFTFAEVKNEEIFPLVENEVISVNLQFANIEPAPFVYEQDMSEATWIAELFPEGNFVEEEGVMLSEIIRINDNSSYTLQVPVDVSNFLVAYRIAQDGAEFPFKKSDIIHLCLRVAEVRREPSVEEGMASWTASLAPMGEVINNTIICEAERIDKAN